MKKVLLLIIVLCSTHYMSCAQFEYYGIKGSIDNWSSSAPSYIIIQVKSETYSGDALIYSDMMYDYYCRNVSHKRLSGKRYLKLCYRDIKQGKVFEVHDSDFVRKEEGIQYYCFEKVSYNKEVIDDYNKGLYFFIGKYFDEKGKIKPCKGKFYTIVKLLFDADIQVGRGCVWQTTYIQDNRFYKENSDGSFSFIVPKEFLNNYQDSQNPDSNL